MSPGTIPFRGMGRVVSVAALVGHEYPPAFLWPSLNPLVDHMGLSAVNDKHSPVSTIHHMLGSTRYKRFSKESQIEPTESLTSAVALLVSSCKAVPPGFKGWSGQPWLARLAGRGAR